MGTPVDPTPSRRPGVRAGRAGAAKLWTLLGIVAALAVLAVTALMRSACLAGPPRPQTASPAPVAPGSSLRKGAMLGLNAKLSREHIDSIADDLGLSWIRVGVEWRWHEDRAKYDADMRLAEAGELWSVLKDVRESLDYAHQKGLHVLVIAMSSPRWARGADRTDPGNPWHQAILPAHRIDFAQYVRQLCLAGADAVEITNEPNAGTEYALGPEHPRAQYPQERVDDYVLLVRKVHEVVRSDPRLARCKLGLGGVTPVGHEEIPEKRFIHANIWYARLFDAKADDRTSRVSVKGHFDFAAVHPYTDANSGKGPTEWDHRWSRFMLRYGDAAYAHGMAQVIRTRQILVAAGEGDKKLWATEVGSATFGGECRSRPCVSPEQQALWLDQYLRAWFSKEQTGWHKPLASHYYGAFTGPLFVYQWRDQSDGTRRPLDKEGFFGLQRYDGTPKPAFGVLKRRAREPLGRGSNVLSP